jgi:hypothetical protein
MKTMQKYLKASSAVLALALVPLLAFSEAALAKKGGEGGGNSGGNAGQSESAASNAGRSEASPGQTGSAPGLAGSTPGQLGATPATGAPPPGLAGTAPGLARATPGQAAGLQQDVTGSVASSAARYANFGSLISSINNADAQAQQLRSLSNIGQVTFVDASSLTRGSRAKALDNALNRTELSELRTALSSNEALSNVLAANDIELNDVISVRVMTDGDLVVYTR